MNSMTKTPMPEQDAAIRATNFKEVALGYTVQMAQDEAARCLQCKNAPCVSGCPVNVPIRDFIAQIRQGDYAGAYATIRSQNGLPAICGRVCPQETQCESKCVRGIKGEPVGIGRLERFVADWAMEHGATVSQHPSPKGKRAAVIGSGPAGLTCAADLAQRGWQVTVYEALHTPGGVLMYGIPEFRLPKALVQREIDAIKTMGVEFITNAVVGRSMTVDELLVAVIGGGNVAMDAARCARRLGAEVTIVYRRSEKEMPARLEEVHHAREEGVIFRMLTNPTAILGDESGFVRAMTCVEMELGEPDERGRRRPIPKPDSAFDLPVETVIVAIGNSPNPLIKKTTPDLPTEKWGGITADASGKTGKAHVYAGGDAVTGAATVILAMGAGKKAAAAMDEAE